MGNKKAAQTAAIEETTIKRLHELQTAAKPLQDFLAKYYDLETIVIVDIMYASVSVSKLGALNKERSTQY